MTGSATASAFGAGRANIVACVPMTSGATRLLGLNIDTREQLTRHPRSASEVFSLRDSLKMPRINTVSNTTQVVQNLLRRDRAAKQLIADTVSPGPSPSAIPSVIPITEPLPATSPAVDVDTTKEVVIHPWAPQAA